MRFYIVFLWLLFQKCYMCEIIAKATNLVCQPNEKLVKNTKCYIRAESWENSKVQMECVLNKTLRNPILYVQTLKKDYSNQYQPFLVNISFSICDAFSKRKFLHYSNAIMKTLKKYSNANHSCPFEGPLIVRDMKLDLLGLPPTSPIGSYLATFTFIENFPNGLKESFGSIKLYFEILQKRQARRKHKENKGSAS